MNYSADIGFKRNMVDVIGLGAGCLKGVLATTMSLPAAPAILFGVALSVATDYAKERLSN